MAISVVRPLLLGGAISGTYGRRGEESGRSARTCWACGVEVSDGLLLSGITALGIKLIEASFVDCWRG
jgi:hypothetical protein